MYECIFYQNVFNIVRSVLEFFHLSKEVTHREAPTSDGWLGWVWMIIEVVYSSIKKWKYTLQLLLYIMYILLTFFRHAPCIYWLLKSNLLEPYTKHESMPQCLKADSIIGAEGGIYSD